MTLELARRVGPRGTAVGIDIDEIKLALARQDADREGLCNITFHTGDAMALRSEDAYDLVYARFLLTHLPDPQTVVQQMLRATRPGGDPEIGPKLHGLLRQAGAHDLGLSVVQPTFVDHNAKHIHQITLSNIADAVLANGLTNTEELAVLEAELEAIAQDPHTLVSFPRLFQVWGRRRTGDAAVTGSA